MSMFIVSYVSSDDVDVYCVLCIKLCWTRQLLVFQVHFHFEMRQTWQIKQPNKTLLSGIIIVLLIIRTIIKHFAKDTTENKQNFNDILAEIIHVTDGEFDYYMTAAMIIVQKIWTNSSIAYSEKQLNFSVSYQISFIT